MNVLLINPGHDSRVQHVSHRVIHRDPPPVGLLYIGSYLKAHGVDVHILDTHIVTDWRKYLWEYIKQDRPTWIGLSVIIGQPMRNAAEITKFVRGVAPGIPIVWGGVMPTCMPGQIEATYAPDALVAGYGYREALELATSHGLPLNVRPVSNGSHGSCQSVVPNWSLLGSAFNREQIPYYHMVMTSLGCPYRCTFCYNQSIGRKGWSMRDIHDVTDELEAMHALCGTTVFTFGDDNFLGDKERAMRILLEVYAREWYLEEVIGHINALDDALIMAMEGTVQTFIFSIESAVPRLQKMLRKRVKLHEVPDKVGKLAQAGIVSNCSFIIGLPDENDSDLEANWDYMERLREVTPWVRGQVYFWFPLPKTELTYYAEKLYGINLHFPIKDYEDANFWCNAEDDRALYFRPWLTEARYMRLIEWARAFKERFAFPEGYKPYVLDRVLRGETINLQEDLPR